MVATTAAAAGDGDDCDGGERGDGSEHSASATAPNARHQLLSAASLLCARHVAQGSVQGSRRVRAAASTKDHEWIFAIESGCILLVMCMLWCTCGCTCFLQPGRDAHASAGASENEMSGVAYLRVGRSGNRACDGYRDRIHGMNSTVYKTVIQQKIYKVSISAEFSTRIAGGAGEGGG